ncbi:MAG: HlyD family efflux transporter periplasmic adaptor subunit [Firmicutes bacterium]|nr:HlyD family efflux transporter periplasmic adaptor subunit [Bacillota bacterium]
MKIFKKQTLLLVFVAVITVLSGCNKGANKVEVQTPIIGTIEKTIESTGLIIFDDDYVITSGVNAKVLSAEFNEGQTVFEGQVLYTLESKDIQNQISQANINLEKASEAYRHSVNAVNDLSVRAFASGMVTKTYCHIGDFVSSGGRIADIVDSSRLTLRVPFNVRNEEVLYEGCPAQVIMEADGSVINGRVTKVFGSSQPLEGRQFGVNAEITITNPGALKQGDTAFAKIGEITSVTSGSLKNGTEQYISATQSGQVMEMRISEGSNVHVGEVIAVIKNDSLQNAANTAAINIKDIRNLLSQLTDKLSDYQITAQIDGVIIEKNAKEFDIATIGAPLAVIADKEKLCVEAEIDEMYINDIFPGQKATSAIQGAQNGGEYAGRVISISDSGVAKNGVTYYKVKISLDNSDGLMEAMNMDIKIIASSKENAMIIPTSALNGNKVSVLEGKKVVEKEVAIGVKNKKQVEVLSGLTLEDKILEANGK